MKNYAHIEDGKVINVTVCDDPEYAKQRKWVDITDEDPQPGIGWTKKPRKGFAAPEPLPVADPPSVPAERE